jgi:ketosteroid isomerase-like protein
VQQFIAARAAGDVEGIATVLADDAVWRLPVSANFGPFEGRDVVAKAQAGGVSGTLFDMSTVRRDVHKMVVEGDTAVVQQRLSATTLQDKEYVNEYCWVYTCRDGKIARLEEYADTLHAARIFGTVKS